MFLKAKGEALLDKGFPIVPIKKGFKHPGMTGWESMQATTEDVRKWVSNGRAEDGVGILAANFPGVDLDILDADVALQLEEFTLARLGPAPIRIGKAPKRLLIYYTPEPFAKVQSSTYIDSEGRECKAEILGKGQQYVAYHIHPETNQPYTYVGRELSDYEVWELKPILQADAVAICLEFQRIAESLGWQRKGRAVDDGPPRVRSTDVEGDFLGAKPATALTLERIREILFAMPELAVGRDDWLRVCQAIHHQFAGSKEGYALFNEWSQLDGSYDEADCLRVYRSLKITDDQSQVTFASILWMFKAAGGDSKILDELIERIKACESRDDLLTKIPDEVGPLSLTDIDLEQIAQEMRARHKLITGIPIKISMMRGLLRKAINNYAAKHKAVVLSGGKRTPMDQPLDHSGFPHVVENLETGALQLRATVQNLDHMLKGYGISLLYDVILKNQDICMPAGYIEDCQDISANAKFQEVRSLLSLNDVNLFAMDFLPTLMLNAVRNPVIDWITGTTWDGVDRLRALFDTVEVDEADNIYRDKILQLWMIQCVAAADAAQHATAFMAAPAYEGVLVFQGEQGSKKTTWFRGLVDSSMSEYVVTGCHLEPNNKDSVKKAISSWICEMGEIDSSFKKSDISQLKAFLSHTTDEIRLPYEKLSNSYLRRTSFCGSVNDVEFLTDSTGARRFYPLNIKKANADHSINMQQVWAQIWESLYLKGAQWWPDAEMVALLTPKHEEHAQGCDVIDGILSYFKSEFDGHAGDGVSTFFTATEIMERIGVQKGKQNLNKISAYFRKIGAKRLLIHGRKGYYLIPISEFESDNF